MKSKEEPRMNELVTAEESLKGEGKISHERK